MSSNIYILGIETSCDETAASVTLNGRKVLSNIISSQIDTHKKFGGVVPEVASRNHVEKIDKVVDEALKQSGITLKELDAIAVTNTPGLVGALLVGLSYAKALSYVNDIPMIKVNHIEGHICANYIDTNLEPPFISLVVSGGHTLIIYVKDYDEYKTLGTTRDDACGEAFDKIARVLNLEYPGGPKIDKLSKKGNREAISFKRITLDKESLDFSFSGLKSNVLNYINKSKMKEEKIIIEDVCASFQEAVIDVLLLKVMKAVENTKVKKIALSGGVASNSRLREVMKKECEKSKIDLFIPENIYCTDNGAMISIGGFCKLAQKIQNN